MAVIDVRKNNSEDTTAVIFSEYRGTEHQDVASTIVKSGDYRGCVEVWDGALDFVLIESVEHARNLKKALDKAIELGWLK